jgi:UDP-N-acetylmuramate--alanine ligase
MTAHYHFIGIGGIGMSSLAQILLERGYQVSGSDLALSPITERLKTMGARIYHGQSPENISPLQTVVFSTDIKETNPEYQAAITLKCRMEHRSECLLGLMDGKKVLAVGGSHGKTTTTSLLAWVLEVGGMQPTFAVGGIAKNFQTNGKVGVGPFFVAEADESDGTLAKYRPYGAIVTNIGLDHMYHFKSEKALLDCFHTFFSQIRSASHTLWCGDDARLRKMNPLGTSYGFGDHCHLKIDNYRQQGWKSVIDLDFEGRQYADIELSLAGRHNSLNASAVFGLALRLGVTEPKIRQAMKTFQGVARRCEVKGELKGILFLDDYAHHPTEIQATLKAIREAIPQRRLIAVFQPHRYSRTRDCMGSYGPIFNSADQVFITDIHSAGELPIPGVEVDRILDELKLSSSASCTYLPREGLSSLLLSQLKQGDVVVTLGAGNITNLGSETLERFT